jgi:hypothetical protein
VTRRLAVCDVAAFKRTGERVPWIACSEYRRPDYMKCVNFAGDGDAKRGGGWQLLPEPNRSGHASAS